MLLPSLREMICAGLVAALSLLPVQLLQAQEVDVWSRPVQAERNRSCDFIHYRVKLTFDLDAKIFRVDLYINLFSLGQDRHRNRGSVYPALGFGLRDTLHTVDSAFVFEATVYALARYKDDNLLKSSDTSSILV